MQLGGGEGSTSVRTGLSCWSGPGREEVFSALRPRGHTPPCPLLVPRGSPGLTDPSELEDNPSCGHMPRRSHSHVTTQNPVALTGWPAPLEALQPGTLSTWETTDFRCLGSRGHVAAVHRPAYSRPGARTLGPPEGPRSGGRGQRAQRAVSHAPRWLPSGPGVWRGAWAVFPARQCAVPPESREQVHVHPQAPAPVVSLPRVPEPSTPAAPLRGHLPAPLWEDPPQALGAGTRPFTCHLAPVASQPPDFGARKSSHLSSPGRKSSRMQPPILPSPLPLPRILTQEAHGAGLPRLPAGRPQ